MMSRMASCTLHTPAALAALSLLLWASRADAGGPVGANGTPIATSNYTLDLFQGPVFAGARVTGLGGAYVAIAEDVDGDLQNPAAPAVRPFFSYTNFDYWLGFGLTFPASIKDTDFFNSGSKTTLANAPDSFVFFTPALNLQWGELGIGANLELKNYALSQPAAEGKAASAMTATIPTIHLQVAHGFFHNQWVLGVGARVVSMSVRDAKQGRPLFSSSGSGLELGVVYKPELIPLRLGFAYRTAVVSEPSYRDGLLPNENGDLVVSDAAGNAIFLPKTVALPWDLNFGFAVQFGKRPLNPPWRTTTELAERQTLLHRLREIDRESKRNEETRRAKTPEERRELERVFEREQQEDDAQLERELASTRRNVERELAKMNRFYVQIAASMLVSGALSEAVGVESMVAQTVNRSGREPVGSPRLGIESGLFPTFLKVRAGTYLEPTRFDEGERRLHVTAGLDIKLLRWNVFGLWPDDYLWRLGLGADVAYRYSTWGLTLAGWYPRYAKPGDVLEPAPPAAELPAEQGPGSSAAPPTEGSSLEISGSMGPSIVFGEPANPAYTQSSLRRVGVFGEAAVAYRSSYFLDPFISVGYAALASGKSELPSGPWGAGGTLDQQLNAWVISPGITIDIWRIRLRYGLGLALITQSFSYLGQEHSSTQKPLVHQGGLGFNVLDTAGFRLDAETRLVTAPGADVTFMTFDVVARGDLVRFGTRKK